MSYAAPWPQGSKGTFLITFSAIEIGRETTATGGVPDLSIPASEGGKAGAGGKKAVWGGVVGLGEKSCVQTYDPRTQGNCWRSTMNEPGN